jgi:hypothetical protein
MESVVPAGIVCGGWSSSESVRDLYVAEWCEIEGSKRMVRMVRLRDDESERKRWISHMRELASYIRSDKCNLRASCGTATE